MRYEMITNGDWSRLEKDLLQNFQCRTENIADSVCNALYSDETQVYKNATLSSVVKIGLKDKYKKIDIHYSFQKKRRKRVKESAFIYLNAIDSNKFKVEKGYNYWKTLKMDEDGDCATEQVLEESRKREPGVMKQKAVDVTITDDVKCEYYNLRLYNEFQHQIGNNFNEYYDNIRSIIEKSSVYFREDLGYILLDFFAETENKTVQLDLDDVILLEENGCLKFYDYTSAKELKQLQELIKKAEKLMNDDSIKFPIKFKQYIDEDEKCISLERYYVDIQIALLFYPQFRNLFKPNARTSYKYSHISEILDNVSALKDNAKKADLDIYGQYDEVLLPYIIERITGYNLCIQFVHYYAKLADTQEFKQNKRVSEKLISILKSLNAMPNVFSRIQIMMEFLEPIILYNEAIIDQLIIVDNILRYLSEGYFEEIERVKMILKKLIKTYNISETLCGQRISKELIRFEDMKKNYTNSKNKSYIFTKSMHMSMEESLYYKELQKMILLDVNI